MATYRFTLSTEGHRHRQNTHQVAADTSRETLHDNEADCKFRATSITCLLCYKMEIVHAFEKNIPRTFNTATGAKLLCESKVIGFRRNQSQGQQKIPNCG